MDNQPPTLPTQPPNSAGMNIVPSNPQSVAPQPVAMPQANSYEVFVAKSAGFSMIKQGTLTLNGNNLSLSIGSDLVINGPIQSVELVRKSNTKYLMRSGGQAYTVRFVLMSRFTSPFAIWKGIKNGKSFAQTLKNQDSNSQL